MKNLKFLSFVLLTPFVFGCTKINIKHEVRDTNLLFWVAERDLEKISATCTFLPGWFGADEFLDPRYEASYVDDRAYAPDIHVTYLVSGYPDMSDSWAITRINITDPNIYLFGLSMKSSLCDISDTMSKEGYKIKPGGLSNVWWKGDCSIAFWEDNINIHVEVTNNQGIVF